MDELNKRVLSVMLTKNLSKSAFATLLDISLPVLTHIGSGRNKPGLEMIQKILDRFPDINPDWLILGTGNMYRESVKRIDLQPEMVELDKILEKMPRFEQNAKQISDYHALLLKEILYLNELGQYLQTIKNDSLALQQQMQELQLKIKLKVED